jgi:hypothetical protein
MFSNCSLFYFRGQKYEYYPFRCVRHKGRKMLKSIVLSLRKTYFCKKVPVMFLKTSGLFILALYLGFLLPGERRPQTSFVEKKPQMQFDSLQADLGVLQLGDTAELVFQYQNKGWRPIVIYSIKTECGCAIASWDDKPVRRNERSSIRVQFKAIETGYFRKSILVHSNAKNSPIELHLQGRVEKNN